MEQWLLWYDRQLDATPWPFDPSWDDFVAAPQTLVEATDNLACVSPCDGLDETPSVPANLPRALPTGRYLLSVHHDPRNLYVLLESPVSSRPLHAVTFFWPDERSVTHLSRDDQGQLNGVVRPYVYGKRGEVPSAQPPEWDMKLSRRNGRDLACWRIARRDLPDVLRFSVSRVCLNSMEAVAWGSYHVWGVRHDEMGLLRLVSHRQTPPWPRLQRMELHYDSQTQTGRFRLLCDGLYSPDEEVSLGKTPWQVHWRSLALRLNGRYVDLPLAAEAVTPALPLAHGVNVIESATTGGPLATLTLTVRDSRRIVEPALPRREQRSTGPMLKLLRQECEAMIAAAEERRRGGEAMVYVGWRPHHVAAMARMHHYFDKDERYLEMLREEADFTLTLQREDGTFSGLHLAHLGVQPRPWRGGAYDSGPVGDLWVVAHRLLGEEKYLRASQRLLKAYQTYPTELNHNYAAFALYHLTSHYRATRDPAALERGLYYVRHCVVNNLLPCGVHAGHNYYSCYSSIVLGAMAEFCAVLPPDEPLRGVLRDRSVRMTNELLSRMQEDGRFDMRDRYHLNLHMRMYGFLETAFLVAAEDVAKLDAVLDRMEAGEPQAEGADGLRLERRVNPHLVRYLAHRDALLAGQPVDSPRLL